MKNLRAGSDQRVETPARIVGLSVTILPPKTGRKRPRDVGKPGRLVASTPAKKLRITMPAPANSGAEATVAVEAQARRGVGVDVAQYDVPQKSMWRSPRTLRKELA